MDENINNISQEIDSRVYQPEIEKRDTTEIETTGLKPKDLESSSSFANTTSATTAEPIQEDRMKKKKKPDPPALPIIPYYKMFRFSSKFDYLLMFVGSFCAIANGATMPAISIAFGRLLNVFSPDNFKDPNYDLMDQVTKNALIFVYIGIGAFVCSYFEVAFWMLTGERQAIRCRKEYFKAILRQEIGWYDITKSSELSSRISSDTLLFQEAIGEKVGNFLHHGSTFIAGFVIGFIYGWQLTLVIAAVTPLISAAGAFLTKMMIGYTMEGLASYAKASAVAEEKIGSIRTVATFSGERYEANRYSELLKEALLVGKKKGLMGGIGMGLVFFVLFGIYSLSFWYGGKLIVDKHWNPVPGRNWNGGDVLTVIFSVITGAMALGQASPHLASFASGRGAAFKIYQVINRKSNIDPFSTEGLLHNDVQGNIEYRNVSFAYPSRPDVQVFNNFNLSIKQGQTVALVGDSGGGKSSAIALLERFYDPIGGEILLDGINIKDINVNCLRSNIGLVSQEPVLFATTIADNIRYGDENATMDQIIEACKVANAHDFISALPEKYETLVGEKGVQMSGGQKQRIAIARAMIKNPRILLLDEATSALDTENEYLVQQAIDKLMKGRTTIVIAHRLSTIINSDVIAVVKEGHIVEKGTHGELLSLGGAYTELFTRQQTEKKEVGNSENKSTNPVIESESTSSISPAVNNMEIVADTVNNPAQKKERSVPFSRVLKLSKPDWPFFVLGFIGSSINGACMPIFAIIFSEILKVFQETDQSELSRGARNMALWFLLLAVVAGFANFLSNYCFTYIGEKLTYNLRRLSFDSIIRQDIGWFDLPENATGKLTTNLATDTTMVQSITSQRLSLLIQNSVTVIVALIISFIAGWKLTLVVLACVPLLAFAGKVQVGFITGFTKKNKGAYGECGQVATEAIGGIRTVSSFTSENRVLTKFSNNLIKPLQISIKSSNISGISFGFSHATLFFIYCLTYWYGGKLISEGEWKAPRSTIETYCIPANNFNDFGDYDTCVKVYNTVQGYGSMMKIFFAVIMCAMGVGNSMSYAPDIAKASQSATSIFRIIDHESKIDPFSNKGQTPNQLVGNIEFRNVSFRYPSRPNKVVFNGLNLSVPQGKKFALVGDSGGGKSTVISLLERFYDPLEGSITLDGIDIKDINLNWLRSNLGLVNQEPFLFSGTILDNIKYGKKDATMEEVIEAAKTANAHGFISEFKDGYNTELGDKFTHLSGGQKQRVAIARAIICNPKILLLDEATSALDSVSEKAVQEALDNAMKGRTTIVIAHRLSTIIDSDKIAVIKEGKVAEIGDHNSLLAQSSIYSQLISRQI
ncbi:hypothetical protein DICPUDRAFT_80697 [Dictyostelium purpureum]|uniref:ABC transporter B family protein n=1 Tax=Dictyostelium purpureum TaxID=5786 RepID=F0ZR92_DICPU|nr:uncharacterized protein DICPUDRAFT_80697 [Dictyostelium purpureum]EGC33546.1 hypothetical protein DICPUDRAFT_80697 [Dictyostelium purpureum]|eukprot:XP_003289928.1 hypothetical protein DICPUDRAFT_80697 [Dictyostelium purpureum]